MSSAVVEYRRGRDFTPHDDVMPHPGSVLLDTQPYKRRDHMHGVELNSVVRFRRECRWPA